MRDESLFGPIVGNATSQNNNNNSNNNTKTEGLAKNEKEAK